MIFPVQNIRMKEIIVHSTTLSKSTTFRSKPFSKLHYRFDLAAAIARAVLVLGKRTITDLPTIIIALTTIVLLLKFKKLQEPLLILAAAVVGIILKTAI